MKPTVRIINSSGIGRKTEIRWADSLEQIPGIQHVEIDFDVHGLVRAKLTFVIPVIDISGIASLSEQSKQDLRDLIALMKRIEDMEAAQQAEGERAE